MKQNASEYLYELRAIREKRMRDFGDMLKTIQDTYGDSYPMIVEDWVGIKISKAEALSFTNEQFKALQELCQTPKETVSYSYAN